ncbi:MAG TPA: hypothetical protein DEP87_00800 [Candidatus Pacebacteria bacterium]|nr:hypothetical protein [Candidatus Paceibacterota bacterium]
MSKVVFSRRFERELRQLLRRQHQLRPSIEKTIQKLLCNPQHPSLRLHKLNGDLGWSISVTMAIRIIVYFENDTWFLLRIGNHDAVY